MPDMLTVSTKGQITLPVGLLVEYGLEADNVATFNKKHFAGLGMELYPL